MKGKGDILGVSDLRNRYNRIDKLEKEERFSGIDSQEVKRGIALNKLEGADFSELEHSIQNFELLQEFADNCELLPRDEADVLAFWQGRTNSPIIQGRIQWYIDRGLGGELARLWLHKLALEQDPQKRKANLEGLTGESLEVLCFIYQNTTKDVFQVNELQEIFTRKKGGGSSPKEVITSNITLLDFLLGNSLLALESRLNLSERVLSIIFGWDHWSAHGSRGERPNDLEPLMEDLKVRYKDFVLDNLREGIRELKNPETEVKLQLQRALDWEQMQAILGVLSGCKEDSQARSVAKEFELLNRLEGAFKDEDKGVVLAFWQGGKVDDAFKRKIEESLESYCNENNVMISTKERDLLKEKGLFESPL